MHTELQRGWSVCWWSISGLVTHRCVEAEVFYPICYVLPSFDTSQILADWQIEFWNVGSKQPEYLACMRTNCVSELGSLQCRIGSASASDESGWTTSHFQIFFSWLSFAGLQESQGCWWAYPLIPSMQEVLTTAGGSCPVAFESATGVYIGCMYTEYLDTVLAPQVSRFKILAPASSETITFDEGLDNIFWYYRPTLLTRFHRVW